MTSESNSARWILQRKKELAKIKERQQLEEARQYHNRVKEEVEALRQQIAATINRQSTTKQALTYHPDTRELLCRHYWDMKDLHKSDDMYQRIYLTLSAIPSMKMIVTVFHYYEKQLVQEMMQYPETIRENKKKLRYLTQFNEIAQEFSCFLHEKHVRGDLGKLTRTLLQANY